MLRKKIMSAILAFVLIAGMNVNIFGLESNNSFDSYGLNRYVDEFDIIFAAASKLNSENLEEDLLPSGSKVENVILLYDDDENVKAFYVSFSPTGYAIVNNNKLNPTLIEYGRGKNENIEKIIREGQKVIYNNPVDIYSSNYDRKSLKNSKDLYYFYPELSQPNLKLQEEIFTLKAKALSNNISTMGDGDYGFIDWGDMPSGNFSSNTIDDASSTSWITTGETSDIANNHCGATAVTNIALYYAERGYDKLKINDSNLDTFKAVHKIVGNGPVVSITSGANKYFKDRGYSLSSSSVGSFNAVKSAVNSNQIQGVLLSDGIFNWHWILAVGYRQYDSGEKYMRIVNGWDNSIDVFYKIHSGSAWFSAQKYWVK